jgi:hypothetical protein
VTDRHPAVTGWLDDRGADWKNQVAFVSLQRSVIGEPPTGLPDDAVEWPSSMAPAIAARLSQPG